MQITEEAASPLLGTTATLLVRGTSEHGDPERSGGRLQDIQGLSKPAIASGL
jgi:hypothetical protein